MKRIQKLLVLILLLGLVVTYAASDTLYAQRTGPLPGRPGAPGAGAFLQYVVKFVCGDWPYADWEEMAPGQYYTDVNIHNPNDKIIKFRKKIALDGWAPQHHGVMTSPIEVMLGPDEALEINCDDILEIILKAGTVPGIPPDFVTFKGFVVIYSRVELDVAAIYTACPIDWSDGIPGGCNPGIAGDGISTIFVDQPIPPSPVPAPAVYVDGLSVGSAGVSLSVEPFSRFAYDGARLMVYDINGSLLHDSGFVAGTQLSWRPMSAGRPLANGVYFYVVAVRDVLGQVSYKVGKFALLR